MKEEVFLLILVCVAPFVVAVVMNRLVADAIRGRRTVPGVNWFVGSVGALFVVSCPGAMLAAFADPQTAWIMTLLAAGMIGAVVDIPLSIRRNQLEGRSAAWILVEAGALGVLLIGLWIGFGEVGRRAPPQNWGALG